MQSSAHAVFEALFNYLSRAQSAGTLQLLQRAVLLKAFRSLEREGHWPILDFPLALHRSLGGQVEVGQVVAGACALFYAYADVTDDAEDHDLAEEPWAEWGWEQAVNTGNALLFTCFQYLYDSLPSDAAAPLVETFVRAGVTMTQGQHFDLVGQAAQEPGVQAYFATIERKSGASFGAYAKAVALANETWGQDAERFHALGKTLGMMFQMMNDTHELWGPRLSSDFANRRLSFPIVLALEQVSGARPSLARLLAGPATLEHQFELVRLLESSGIKAYAALRIEVYRKKAHELASDLGVLSEPYLCKLLEIPAFPEAGMTI